MVVDEKLAGDISAELLSESYQKAVLEYFPGSFHIFDMRDNEEFANMFNDDVVTIAQLMCTLIDEEEDDGEGFEDENAKVAYYYDTVNMYPILRLTVSALGEALLANAYTMVRNENDDNSDDDDPVDKRVMA